MKELANNFVFRYVSNSKHFNINQLIKIIKYPTNDMILDVITRSNKLEPLIFTPFVIDFDVKDERVFNELNYDQLISDVKDIVVDILSEYELNTNNYDSNLFNYLLSICDFEFNNCELVINEYDKNFDSFINAIVQKKNNKFNFHIIYPFVIVEDKDRIYDKIKERLNEIYGIDFNGIIDNHLKTNSLRVINCSKKDRSVEDEYYIDTVNSDVSDEFINTKRNGLNDINEKVLKLNIMLCSLQWSRCELINGYTFTPKDQNDKDNIRDNEIDNSDEINSSDENNNDNEIDNDNEILSDCEDEFDISDYVSVKCNEEIKELSKYSIDDVVYALDNFEDDYWKNQNYDEWRNTIWSCRWFSDSLNDQDDIIYDKVITKCKLYPGGINKKQFRQIWNDYDNNRGDKIRGKLMINFKNKCRDKYNERFNKNYEWTNDNEDISINTIEFNNKDFDFNVMVKYGKDGNIEAMMDYFQKYYIKVNDTNDYEWFKIVRLKEKETIKTEEGLSTVFYDNINIEGVKKINNNFKVAIKDDNGKVRNYNFLDYGWDKINYYNTITEQDKSSYEKPFIYYELHTNKQTGEQRKIYYLNKNEVIKSLFLNRVMNVKSYDINKTEEGFRLIIDYLRNVICLSKIRNNGLLEIDIEEQNNKYLYLMSFIKRIFNLQKNHTALILYGHMGNGKSSLFVLLKAIMGKLGMMDGRAKILDSRFNIDYKDKYIVSLEEFDKASENIKVDLKNNITNDTFDKLERKGKDNIIDYPNTTSFIITTNNINELCSSLLDSEENKDRRYVMFNVLDDRIGDYEYWKKLYDVFKDKYVLKRFYDYVKDNEKFNYVDYRIVETKERSAIIRENTASIYDKFIKDLFLMINYLSTKTNIIRYNNHEIFNRSRKTHKDIDITFTCFKKMMNEWIKTKNIDDKKNDSTLRGKLLMLFTDFKIDRKNQLCLKLDNVDNMKEILINHNIIVENDIIYDEDEIFCKIDYLITDDKESDE